MGQEQAYYTLLAVAKKKNVPVETVIAEIEKAIRAGYESRKKNNDEAGLRAWKEIPCAGEVPTALEMMAYLNQITDGLNDRKPKNG